MMTYIYSTYLPAAVPVAVPKYEDLPLPMPSTRIRLCAHCPSGKKDSWKTTKNADIISKLVIVLITSHIDNILISSVPQYYMFIDNPPFPILRPSVCTRFLSPSSVKHFQYIKMYGKGNSVRWEKYTTIHCILLRNPVIST